MEAKSTPRETSFAPGTSRNREDSVTLRLVVARDEVQLLEMGQRIAELRESNGYKQQWIADKVGVTLRTYQFWQAGKFPPEQENLEKLAKLFNVTPRFILKGETPAPFVNGADRSEILELLRRLDQRLTDAETRRADGLAAQLERFAVVLQQLERIEDAMREIAPRQERTA
jgi:transcriptional regulator with XRE-family HTH domain